MTAIRQTLPLVTNATEIATERFPLRASALPKIQSCPASVFMSAEFWKLSDTDEEGGGAAAQTGNLVHSAANMFHLLPEAEQAQRLEAGLAALEQARERFPIGEVGRAKKIFEAYANDKENKEAKVIRNESKVTAKLPPAPFDPTGLPVVIRGTLDQVRLINGVPKVFDIKTGRMYYGKIALDHYMTQQAAYVVAADQTWGAEFAAEGLPRVEPGALICTDGYFRPMGQVQWHHSWEFDDIPLILQNVVVQVAAARQKMVSMIPSVDSCRWCEFKKFQVCKSFYQEHVQ
jgi:hypothetical protein